MDFTNTPRQDDVVDLTNEVESEGLPSQEEAPITQHPVPQNLPHIAYTTDEQFDFAATSYIPINTQMRPDPDNANQMREFVFPGTWHNFNDIRYVGTDVAVLELQLAQAYGLQGLVRPDDPRVQQALRDRLQDEGSLLEGAQQGGVLQGDLRQGGFQHQQQDPTMYQPAAEDDIMSEAGDQQPFAQGTTTEAPSGAPDSGMPIMSEPLTNRPGLSRGSVVSRFVESFNENLKRGGRVEKDRK